jgi:hypothetical protein
MGGHRGEGPKRRSWSLFRRAASFVVCALVVTACAKGPDQVGTPAPEPVGYNWSLPPIDPGGQGADGTIYQALQKNCDDGDAALAAEWQQSSSPREVMMFAAGVQACRGAMLPARTMYQRAKDEYGWSGLGPGQDTARCAVYKSVASVVENAPRDRFPCPDGVSPAFRRLPNGALDDPRTDEDESAAPATSTTPPPTTAPAPPSTHASKAVASRTSKSTRATTNRAANSGGGPPPAPHPGPGKTSTGDDKGSSDDGSSDDGNSKGSSKKPKPPPDNGMDSGSTGMDGTTSGMNDDENKDENNSDDGESKNDES